MKRRQTKPNAEEAEHEKMSREGAVCETIGVCSTTHGTVETGCFARRVMSGLRMH